MKLIDRIGAQYQNLTAKEKRISDLMVEDVKGFALKSIGEIAAQLEISKTTLMRFAKTCGFQGYADFKKELQREVLLDISPAGKMKKIISSDYTLNAEELCAREVANVKSTFEALDDNDLAELTDLIIGADEVHTLSWGLSGHLAEIFSLRMKLMGIRCNTLKRRYGTLIEETSLLKAGDLLLVFEIPPYTHEIIDTVRRLAAKKITIVLVAGTPRCPLTEFATLSFFCATDTMFFGNSLMGPLFWVNLVSSLVIYRKKDKVMDILEEQQKIFNDAKYYCQS